MNSNTVVVRDNSIDIAKGIGIILVVVGHCIQARTYPGIFIYAFHMPLFFIISGLCFNFKKHKEFVPFLSSRLRTLIVPAVIFTIIDIAISQVTAISVVPWSYMWRTGFTGAKWFLGVLFVVEILYYCILRILGTQKHIQIIIIASGFLIGIWLSKEQIKLPYRLCTVFAATSYYGIGNMLRDKIIGKPIVCNTKWAWTIFLVSLSLFLTVTRIVGGGFGMSGNSISFKDIVPSLLGVFTAILFSKIVLWGGQICDTSFMVRKEHACYHVCAYDIYRYFLRIRDAVYKF